MVFSLSERVSRKGPFYVRSRVGRASYSDCLDFLVRRLSVLPHPLRSLLARQDIKGVYRLFENYGITFEDRSSGIYGIPVRNNVVILRPIKSPDVVSGSLVHFGHPYDFGFNNAENLSNSSVWGKQERGEPTYVGTRKVPCSPAPNGVPLVKLLIDKKKLFEGRNIFLDPESLHTHPSEFGSTFMVFGGIPKEAIERIDEVPYFALPAESKSYSVEEFIRDYERKGVQNAEVHK